MRRFSGTGGSVYALGSPLEFREVPLHDCGGGWDWRAPEGLRYWVGEVHFEVLSGPLWDTIGAVEVHGRSGRVSFGRCLQGSQVRASGVCLPTSFLCGGDRWQLDIEAVVRESSALGSETSSVSIRATAMVVQIEGIHDAEPIEEVLVRLPLSGNNMFLGVGRLSQQQDSVVVNLNEEGACYATA